MRDDNVYWIWMQCALGINANVSEIVEYFGTAKELYNSGEYDRKISGVFSIKQIEKLKESNLLQAEKIYDICIANKWVVVAPDNKLYPPLLKKINNFPLVLYVRGDISCLKEHLAIAMVGTREATDNSVSVAVNLSESLVKAGVVIVSGGALGIDSAAHTGALKAKGKTIAVLGCGLDINYPVANEKLRNYIAANGAVVTEYPPGTQAIGRNFPIRNRIISGICSGTVVVEAGERSGSLITASMALEQGREVFAVPGDIMNSKFTGANKLIRDGAKIVLSATDVLEEFYMLNPELLVNYANTQATLVLDNKKYPTVNVKKSSVSQNKKSTEPKKQIKFIKPQAPSYLSKTAMVIFSVMGEKPMQFEEIANSVDASTNEILSALTELELCSLVKTQAGKSYSIISNSTE